MQNQQIQQIKAELANSQAQYQQTIYAMKTSKFWQLRTAWFKLKKALGLPVNE